MTIFYRLCGIASTNPSPIYQEDKFLLNQLCLKSFREAFREVNPEVIILADYCGPEYDKMIKDIIPFTHEIHHSEVGINETCLRQYDLAENMNDDFLFAECDRMWLPYSGKKLENAIKHFGLVSGYDHPDFYSRFDIHPKQCEVELFEDHHYRTAARNVMTFGMTKDTFEKNKNILIKYGYLDDLVWKEMRENGTQLWTALPALETHMVANYMAPSIDWKSIWESYL